MTIVGLDAVATDDSNLWQPVIAEGNTFSALQQALAEAHVLRTVPVLGFIFNRNETSVPEA